DSRGLLLAGRRAARRRTRLRKFGARDATIPSSSCVARVARLHPNSATGLFPQRRGRRCGERATHTSPFRTFDVPQKSTLSIAGVMLGMVAWSQSAPAQTSHGTVPSGRSGQTLDPGVRGGAPGAGAPLPGLSQNELNFFYAAKDVFSESESVPRGVGAALQPR